MFLSDTTIQQSFTYKYILPKEIHSVRSLTNKKNLKGSTTLPCGIPIIVLNSRDLPTTTISSLTQKQYYSIINPTPYAQIKKNYYKRTIDRIKFLGQIKIKVRMF